MILLNFTLCPDGTRAGIVCAPEWSQNGRFLRSSGTDEDGRLPRLHLPAPRELRVALSPSPVCPVPDGPPQTVRTSLFPFPATFRSHNCLPACRSSWKESFGLGSAACPRSLLRKFLVCPLSGRLHARSSWYAVCLKAPLRQSGLRLSLSRPASGSIPLFPLPRWSREKPRVCRLTRRLR